MRIVSSQGPSPITRKSSSEQPLWRLAGIFTRRERWGLSGRGWLLITAVVLAALYVMVSNVYSFLAVTHRVDRGILVIEGWVHRYAVRAGVEEFKTGAYERIFTTGGPVTGSGSYTSDSNTSASVGAGAVRATGVSSELVQMVPSHVSDRDRTYNAAVALREWFHEHNVAVPGINVVTENVHARRTRLLFQEAFGKNVPVGIIAVPNPDYDSKHWWRYSEGVKDVFSESIAYIYAKFFFYPSDSKRDLRR